MRDLCHYSPHHTASFSHCSCMRPSVSKLCLVRGMQVTCLSSLRLQRINKCELSDSQLGKTGFIYADYRKKGEYSKILGDQKWQRSIKRAKGLLRQQNWQEKKKNPGFQTPVQCHIYQNTISCLTQACLGKKVIDVCTKVHTCQQKNHLT